MALLLSTLVLAVGPSPGAHSVGRQSELDPAAWVGVWAAPPEPVINPGDTVSAVRVPAVIRQSFREIVRPTLGGEAVRIRLSNRYGHSPVLLTAFSAALATRGAALRPGSKRTITFGGRDRVTLGPGEAVVSDPVRIEFSFGEKLAISFAAPTYVGLPTSHQGFTTSYRSLPFSGDVTADDSGRAFPVAERLSYFLDGVEAYAPGALGTVVAFGDSITDGTGSTVDKYNTYPDLLAARFNAAGLKVGVVNAGIAGSAAGACKLNGLVFGDSGVERFQRDVLFWPNVRSVIVLLGGNDLRLCSWVRAEDVERSLGSILTQAHGSDLKVALATYPPKVCWTFALPAACPAVLGDNERVRLNNWIRAQSSSDTTVLDWDLLLRNPRMVHELGRQSGTIDGIHPGPAGYLLMSDSAPLEYLAASR